MKKILFASAFALMGTFALANNACNDKDKEESEPEDEVAG